MRTISIENIINEATANQQLLNQVAQEQYGKTLNQLHKSERKSIIASTIQNKIIPINWLPKQTFRVSSVSSDQVEHYPYLYNDHYGEYFTDAIILLKNDSLAQSYRDKYWEIKRKKMLKVIDNTKEVDQTILKLRTQEVNLPDIEEYIKKVDFKQLVPLNFLQVMSYAYYYTTFSLDYPVYLFITNDLSMIVGLQEKYYWLILRAFDKQTIDFSFFNGVIVITIDNNIVGLVMPYLLDMEFINYMKKLL